MARALISGMSHAFRRQRRFSATAHSEEYPQWRGLSCLSQAAPVLSNGASTAHSEEYPQWRGLSYLSQVVPITSVARALILLQAACRQRPVLATAQPERALSVAKGLISRPTIRSIKIATGEQMVGYLTKALRDGSSA